MSRGISPILFAMRSGNRVAGEFESFVDLGVYAVICNKSGNAYVGSSANVSERLKEHRDQLRGQRHKNRKLLHEWNQHGEITFEFRRLERVENAADLKVREQYWIDRMGTLNSRRAA